MAATSGFRFDPSDMLDGISRAVTRSEAAIVMYANNAALVLQNYAKEHRPWTDRTGHARQRLNCRVQGVSNGYQLVLAHGVDYGVWLELAHEKRFAIIMPTITRKGPDVLKGFERLLEKL